MKSRCIDFDIARKYLCQVDFRFRRNKNVQFALGFRNDGGGFEFRNRNLKGFLGDTKTITSINVKAGNKVAVFEGVFDFLSFLSDYHITDFGSSVIILNSTVMQAKAREILATVGFEKAYFFLDNDES